MMCLILTERFGQPISEPDGQGRVYHFVGPKQSEDLGPPAPQPCLRFSFELHNSNIENIELSET